MGSVKRKLRTGRGIFRQYGFFTKLVAFNESLEQFVDLENSGSFAPRQLSNLSQKAYSRKVKVPPGFSNLRYLSKQRSVKSGAMRVNGMAEMM